MKKLLTLFAILIATKAGLFAQTQPTDTDGDGYYNISTLDHLRWVSENSSSWTWDFELDNDIDASDTENWNSGAGFSSVGTAFSNPYTGKFEGHNYEIANLHINRPSDDLVGLFGYIENSSISNVGVINCDVEGNKYVGGLVGYGNLSSLEHCHSTGTVAGKDQVGGLVGQLLGNTVSKSYSMGTVSGEDYVGGLVGQNSTSSTISQSYSAASAAGESYTGGLVGANMSASVSNSYAIGSVAGSWAYTGGLVGYNHSSAVRNSYCTGSVAGNNFTGGFIGENLFTFPTGCLWDTLTSGMTTSDGGTGKSTTDMNTQTTFTNEGWDFDSIWTIHSSINSGYPILKNNHNETIPEAPTDPDADGYYNISTLEHLRWISENDSSWSWNFELDNDIDAADTKNWNIGNHDGDAATPDSAMGWKPIGGSGIKYTGIFEGGGFTISNLYINRHDSYSAFFGYIVEAIIRDFDIDSADITGESSSAVLVGMTKTSAVESCNVSGKVVAEGVRVGGLIGNNEETSVLYCSADVDIDVSGIGESVGGLIGYNDESAAQNCSAFGNVSSDGSYVGGFVGRNDDSFVVNCFARGYAGGTSYIGGFIGFNDNESIIESSYSTGILSVAGNWGGGFCGQNSGFIHDCFWDKDISLSGSSGGVGKTTSEMQTESTFTNAGWNFDFIWKINGGYPYIEIDNTNMPTDSDDDGYIEISSYENLLWLSETGFGLEKNYVFTSYINAGDMHEVNNGRGFIPLGNSIGGGLRGNIDGDGQIIDSLFINRPNQQYVGLFGFLGGGKIKHLAVSNCNITALHRIGGFAGYSDKASKIEESYSTGSISGEQRLGGIVGFVDNSSELSNLYSKSSIDGESYLGGIVGYMYNSTAENCYSTGAVSGTNYLGGLIGRRYGGSVSNCFWDSTTAGQNTSAGGSPKLTSEMKTKSTFTDAGWDFSKIWDIDQMTNEGYPNLRMSDFISHTIPLKQRWNMISTYVLKNPADSFAVITEDVKTNMLLAKNAAGGVYFPNYDIDQIGLWEYDEGFLVYMLNADTLTIEGTPIPQDSTIKLSRQWNIISYPRTSGYPIETCFAGINSNVLLAKNVAGAVYFPGYGIDQIDSLKPGQGYLVYMLADDTLDLPLPNGSLKAPAIAYTPFETKFAKPSPNNATVIIETKMPDGTEIEAYNSIGVLVGSGRVKNGKSPIAIYGDDEFTQEIDGARRDEIITFKAIWDNIKQDLTVESVSSGISEEQLDSVRYSTNALLHAKVSGYIPQTGGTADLTISPNPAEDEAVLGINFAISGDITVEVYDINGDKLSEVYSGKASEQITIDCSKLPSGTYQALVKTNDEVKSVRFVVVR